MWKGIYIGKNKKIDDGGIKMNNLERELTNAKEKTNQILKTVNESMKHLKNDDAKIKVLSKGKKITCYIKETEDDGIYGRYLPVAQRDRAINIVKNEYYTKLKQALEKRIKTIDKTIKTINQTDPIEIYRKIGKGKQRLVESVEMSDEDYRAEWENEKFEGKPFEENAPEIYTDRGERVRSKSEKIIADKLYRENISYRYEYPIEIPYVGTIYPDFTILDEVNRRNIIFEHFGLMNDESYANNAIFKLQTYAREGYTLGDNLFVTMETSERPLDSRMVDGIIKQIKNN